MGVIQIHIKASRPTFKFVPGSNVLGKVNRTMLIKNYPTLVKWPAMFVSGDRITKEQAEEILVRTDGLYFGTNDDKFKVKLHKILGIKAKYNRVYSNYSYTDYDSVTKVNKELNCLDLNHLHNSRIVSNFSGGPHGWCDWDGTIGSNSYNLGKWPEAKDIHDEWSIIAKAFPYLNLHCQLFSGGVYEGGNPVIDYMVKDGKASCVLPTKILGICEGTDRVYLGHGDHSDEHGIDIERFAKIIKRLRGKDDSGI